MEKKFVAYSSSEIETHLKSLKEWEYSESKKVITKTFTFKGYYKTIAFVNSIAWLAQRDCHHPDLFISFGKCVIELTTHDVDGISYKDFELAEKIDSIYF